MRRRNPNAGLVVFWVKLRQRGYKRSITGLYRVLVRNSLAPVKPENPKYIPKPYEQMIFPGQRIQVDVKHVPAACIVGDAEGQKFFQYTAIDEFSRFRYVEAFDEASTYTSTVFLEHVIKAFPFQINCVQTDNGFEFTKRFHNKESEARLTMFENRLFSLGIRHKLIRPFTPRHNGKVERSHRKDNEYFYAVKKFYSFADFKRQLYIHNWKYNRFPMRPLGWKSPKQTLIDFLQDGVTYV
jgi:transposase InsO family protein